MRACCCPARSGHARAQPSNGHPRARRREDHSHGCREGGHAMSGISKSEYIRWVKGSLNRLLGASLPDDGTNTPEYRMWLMSFQTNQKLTVNAQVDLATQNALIKRNRVHDAYVRWVQNALLISGEGIRVGGKAIAANGYWGSDTEQAVKDFQSKHEKMKGDGWVGAKTERALMLRTGTVPP